MLFRAKPALLSALLVGALLAGCSGAPKKTGRSGAAKKPVTPAERLALKHYKLGIDSYANDKYAEAISHWKVTLANDPANANAAEYIGRAENMIKAVKNAPKPKPTATPDPTAVKPK